jgi:VWFA-related protein
MHALKQIPAVALALLLTALLLFSSGTAAQQQAPPAQESRTTIRAGVNLVNLFATVRDNNRRIVPDLTKEDFRLYEDGQEQKVEFFAREVNLPLTLGLLVDTSPSQTDILGIEQDAAARFLQRVMRHGDLTFVISFDTEVDLLSESTEDVARLERAVRRTRGNAAPLPPMVQGPFPTIPRGTRFHDAIYLACREKLASETGRKALVIVTDAQDQGSKVKLEEAIQAAQETNTVVHIILVADPGYYWGRGGYSGNSAAKKVAEETGGRVIEVRSENKLEEAFDQITEELRSQYALGYYPTNMARDGKFRKIKVETSRKDARILARKGYYGPRN